jgi:hypothetical protein
MSLTSRYNENISLVPNRCKDLTSGENAAARQSRSSNLKYTRAKKMTTETPDSLTKESTRQNPPDSSSHNTTKGKARKRTRVLGGGGSKSKSKANEQDIPKRIALAKNQKRERTKREREWLKKKMYIRRKKRVGTQRCSEEAAASLSLPSSLSPLLVFFLVSSTCFLCTPSYSRSKKHGGVQNEERDKRTLNSSQHLLTLNFPPKTKNFK